MFEEFSVRSLCVYANYLKTSDPSYLSLKDKVDTISSLVFDCLHLCKKNFLKIGKLLKEIRDLTLYEYIARPLDRIKDNELKYYSVYVKSSFFDFCFDYLNLCRSTVYNLISVYERFGDAVEGCLPEFKDYSYSQLVELLPLSESQLKQVNKGMSVKRLRELKKTDFCNFPLENKAIVQTSGQDCVPLENFSFLSDPGKTSCPGTSLEKGLNISKSVDTQSIKRKTLKENFTKNIKSFLTDYPYVINLYGRKTSSICFANSLFNYLLDKGVLDELWK